jgi:hypothetical protein
MGDKQNGNDKNDDNDVDKDDKGYDTPHTPGRCPLMFAGIGRGAMTSTWGEPSNAAADARSSSSATIGGVEQACKLAPICTEQDG